jgi:hypothetical protein
MKYTCQWNIQFLVRIITLQNEGKCVPIILMCSHLQIRRYDELIIAAYNIIES